MVRHETDRTDRRVAEPSRRDIEQRHGQDVTRLGPFDVHRTRQGVHGADLCVARSGICVGARWVELEVACVTCLEDNGLPRPGPRGHRDGGVQTVETVRVFAAVPTRAAKHDDVSLSPRRRGHEHGGHCDHGHALREG